MLRIAAPGTRPLAQYWDICYGIGLINRQIINRTLSVAKATAIDTLGHNICLAQPLADISDLQLVVRAEFVDRQGTKRF